MPKKLHVLSSKLINKIEAEIENCEVVAKATAARKSALLKELAEYIDKAEAEDGISYQTPSWRRVRNEHIQRGGGINYRAVCLYVGISRDILNRFKQPVTHVSAPPMRKDYRAKRGRA
jgi:hypothetical protein